MFKINKKKNKVENPYGKILFIQLIVYIACSILYYKFIPYLLNYPPNSINTDFQLTVNPTYYWVYYLSLCVTIVVILFCITARRLRSLKNINKENMTLEEKLKIRNDCNKFSIKRILVTELILPCLIIILGLLIMKTNFILTLKIGFIVFLFLGIPAIIFYIFSNMILENVYISTFDKEVQKKEQIKNTKIWQNIIFQIFPAIMVSTIFILMMFMANLTNKVAEYQYKIYSEQMNILIKGAYENAYDKDSLLEYVKNNSEDENWFIIYNGEYYYGKREMSDFMKQYIKFYANGQNSIIYDSYGENNQGIISTIDLNGEKASVGVIYSVLPQEMFIVILLTVFICLVLDYIVIYLTSSVIGKNIKNISDRLLKISKSDIISESLIPITTYDELGMLTRAFNDVQYNTGKLIKKNQENQDILMERERLASLGQLIGGIAHNLKTPIMSVSGAAEGLTDLINEYDTSIEDPEVNFEDHHDIANDMREWIKKIKSYIEYMSDIITAVKGQAVAMSEQESVEFTVEELVKRVNILMKHELKNAIIYLNVEMNVNPNLTLKGEINGLVQVINNIISNAIQAYKGEPEKNIDMIVNKDNDNLIISIRDYAGGLPEKVKEKLFKEMITTKGKNGTGLGLYMSYSNIRAYFGGTITYDSIDGEGTTFNVILPINK